MRQIADHWYSQVKIRAVISEFGGGDNQNCFNVRYVLVLFREPFY